MQHNHEVSSETFKSYPECRQLCDDEVSFVKPLLELKVRPSMIVAKLKEQTGKGQHVLLVGITCVLISNVQFCVCRKSSDCKGLA